MKLSSHPTKRASSASDRVVRYLGREREEVEDRLAVEEPLQIRLAGEDVAVTMRTPGHDEELAVGFLYTEAIIGGREDVESVSYCLSEGGEAEANVINVLPADRALLAPGRWGRNFISSSSCGLCGKTSIEEVVRPLAYREHPDGTSASSVVQLETLYSLPAKLLAAQEAFEQTGGIHAAGLFTFEGDLIAMREDVGRHNAVDKLVGHALLHEMLPLDEHIILVSSRASFEVVQKALTAGVTILAAVSAPSSLAVDLAREAGITLVGFVRQERLNVYSGEWRIIP